MTKRLSRVIDDIAQAIEQGIIRGKARIATRGPAIIRDRTRAGFGVEGRRKVKLAGLEESTKRSRKTKNLSPETSANTSNLTESGDMLDNIVSKQVANGVSISIAGKDKKKAKGVQKKRPFFSFTVREEAVLTDIIKRELVKQLKKIC